MSVNWKTAKMSPITDDTMIRVDASDSADCFGTASTPAGAGTLMFLTTHDIQTSKTTRSRAEQEGKANMRIRDTSVRGGRVRAKGFEGNGQRVEKKDKKIDMKDAVL